MSFLEYIGSPQFNQYADWIMGLFVRALGILAFIFVISLLGIKLLELILRTFKVYELFMATLIRVMTDRAEARGKKAAAK